MRFRLTLDPSPMILPGYPSRGRLCFRAARNDRSCCSGSSIEQIGTSPIAHTNLRNPAVPESSRDRYGEKIPHRGIFLSRISTIRSQCGSADTSVPDGATSRAVWTNLYHEGGNPGYLRVPAVSLDSPGMWVYFEAKIDDMERK